MMNQLKYGLHGKFNTLPGKAEELASILVEASELMKQAAGCHLYMVSLDPEGSDAVVITEIWDSKDAHDQSLTIPGVRELIGRAMPLLDGPPEKGQELSIIGGLGIV